MGHWKDKTVIGLTGNIATGKSLVRRMLQHLGAYTIDADELAHQVMAPNAPAYRPTIEWFGRWIMDKDRRVDRAKLGAVAFSHPEALKRLESITHPIIGKAINTLITRSTQKVVVVEAIKLLEGPLAQLMDTVWVVDCTEEKQLERLMKKRNLNEADARKRIRLQNPQADKLAAANVVIKNEGNQQETWQQVQAEWAKLHGQPEPTAEDEKRKTQPSSPATPPDTLGEITIKRPKPAHMKELAALINSATGQNLTEADLMQQFLEASYIVAQSNNAMVGTIGFIVENLITQSSQVIIRPGVDVKPVLSALIAAMEEASADLQSEVAFFFLKPDREKEAISILQSDLGYEIIEKVEDIKFPAWREAVRDTQPEGTMILFKKLREERILTPI